MKKSKKSRGSENIVRIGNLKVISATASLSEVVKAVNKLIKQNKDLVKSEEEEMPPMFG